MAADTPQSGDPIALSIVIVNWNVREFLLPCLASVYESATGMSIEVIVVDNASSDGSMDAVAERFPSVVQICNAGNVGFHRANNQGAAVAHGRCVLFLNPDTRVLDGAISRAVRLMDERPDIGALGPKLLRADLRWSRDNGYRAPTLRTVLNEYLQISRLLPFPRLFPGTVRSADFHGLEDCEWISGAAFLVRREVVEQEQWNEEFFHAADDIEYSARIRARGWRVMAYADAQVIHYSGQSMAKQDESFAAHSVSVLPRLLKARERPLSAWTAIALIQLSLLVRSYAHRVRYWISGDASSLQKARRLRQYLLLERSKV
jgi:hypothetical protein